MFDFITGTENYPIRAEYLQLLKPENVDDVKSYEGAVVFQCRVVTKQASPIQDIGGLKGTTRRLALRTKETLPFDKGDLIIVREKTYKIDSVSKVENTIYEKSRILFENYLDYETEIELA
jgi:hypothetical protein